jgi:hypothetical protein
MTEEQVRGKVGEKLGPKGRKFDDFPLFEAQPDIFGLETPNSIKRMHCCCT